MSSNGGTLVAQTLRRFGVRHVTTLPGHQILSVYSACLDEGLDLISMRHEASTTYAAQALAYTMGRPAVALLAGGPSLTNALTGVIQSYYANSPLVVIAGSNTLSKRDKGFPQDMDTMQLLRPFTKWARSCHDVRRIPEYIGMAFRHALRGRPGPVYLEIPYDVMESKVGEGGVLFPDLPQAIRPGPDPAALERAVALIGQADRPLAIAGSGALWSDAGSELAAFAEETQIPLLLTTAALAIPFEPALVFGLGSMGAGRPSLEAIAAADLILLLGTRMNFLLGFGQPPFISPGQTVIQIDIEPAEIDSNRPIDLGIAADIRITLESIRKLGPVTKALDGWRAQLRQQATDFEAELTPLAQGASAPMHPYQLVTAVESVRTDDSILVLDGANSILWALMAARTRPQGGIVISTLGELEAIGAGVPQALALKRANPDRPVILHTGDGSLGYGLIEMETAVRYDIPIVVVVHNDKGWGMTRDMQVAYFGADRELGNALGMVRYDEVVSALGGHGEYVESPADLPGALERALASGRPACVNVLVDAQPKSPGLMMFMMMEVMLGKETYYDRIPDWVRRLEAVGLEGVATKAMLRYMDRMLHGEMSP